MIRSNFWIKSVWSRPQNCTMCVNWMQQYKPSPCHLWDWPESYKQPFCSIGVLARGDLVNNRILQSLINKTWYTSIILCFTNMLQMITQAFGEVFFWVSWDICVYLAIPTPVFNSCMQNLRFIVAITFHSWGCHLLYVNRGELQVKLLQ